jgi:hypothetical protein
MTGANKIDHSWRGARPDPGGRLSATARPPPQRRVGLLEYDLTARTVIRTALVPPPLVPIPSYRCPGAPRVPSPVHFCSSGRLPRPRCHLLPAAKHGADPPPARSAGNLPGNQLGGNLTHPTVGISFPLRRAAPPALPLLKTPSSDFNPSASGAHAASAAATYAATPSAPFARSF